MGSNVLVSIGLPTFNRASKMMRAASTALAQDHENIELIISDNASTDETQQVCQELMSRDRRVRYRRQSSNVGPTRNINDVLRAATGSFYMCLADDDWIAPNYVSACVAALEADRTLSCVAGEPQLYEAGEFRRVGTQTALLHEAAADRIVTFYKTVVENASFYGLSRRELLVSLPPLRNTYAGDWFWIASLAFHGKVQSLSTTHIAKDDTGTSTSTDSIVATLGLPNWQGRYPYESIVVTAVEDVLWRSSAYASLGAFGRARLAARVASALGGRLKPWTRWPAYLKRAARERLGV